jgi:hypothetical protein
MHYLFLSQVTGDNFWSFSFVMIILLPLFLLPVWNFFNLLKFRKVLNILSEDARRRTVATNLLLVVIALLPLYTFGKEYAKSSIYQVGTCLELTGSDEDTYYVNPISCFSDKALEQITQSANSAKDCEVKDYETFSTSLGLFCVNFIREPTEQEAEILENRVVGDEKSGL